jgi:hypothetical protein
MVAVVVEVITLVASLVQVVLGVMAAEVLGKLAILAITLLEVMERPTQEAVEVLDKARQFHPHHRAPMAELVVQE